MTTKLITPSTIVPDSRVKTQCRWGTSIGSGHALHSETEPLEVPLSWVCDGSRQHFHQTPRRSIHPPNSRRRRLRCQFGARVCPSVEVRAECTHEMRGLHPQHELTPLLKASWFGGSA